MTHYDEFGLSPSASTEEIQRAHRHLVRLLHPDPIQDAEVRRLAESQLKRVNTIYSVLIDPVRRRDYDMQLMRHRPPSAEVVNRRPPPPRRRIQWQGPVLVSAISLMAGFQAAVWWGDPAANRERIVYVERSEPGGMASTETAAQPRSAPPLLADTRELRRMLNQVISERDQALARLGTMSSTAQSQLPAVASTASVAPAPSLPGSDAKAPGSTTSITEPPTEAPKSTRTGLEGTWIYSAPVSPTSKPDQYAAEYIELVLAERDGRIAGRYRGRYRVPDRPLSPDVEFSFEGASAGERRYPWHGNAGSAGEVHLALVSENALSLKWFTSQLGRNPSLGSGTAVLVRRRPD